MRVKVKSNVQIFEGSDETDALYAPADGSAESVTDNYVEQANARFLIAPSGSHTVSFGTVATCGGVHVWALGPVNVNINGLGNISLAPSNGAEQGTPCRLTIEGSISSVVITNPSSTVGVQGRVVLWGDPA